MEEELEAIAGEIEGLLPLFVDGDNFTGKFLRTEDASNFKAFAIEAKSIIDDALAPLNDYSMQLVPAINLHSSGFVGGPSYSTVDQASKIIRSAIKEIRRKKAKPLPSPPDTKSYVDQTRIAALLSLSGGKWDYSRLIELCREINVTSANRCHMSTAMLLRTILNHVPPVLGFATFAEVANNYGGGKSFKQSLQRLEGSLRSIADMHLHSPIRSREDVPTSVQVDFSAELDVLLGEVIRVAKSENS